MPLAVEPRGRDDDAGEHREIKRLEVDPGMGSELSAPRKHHGVGRRARSLDCSSACWAPSPSGKQATISKLKQREDEVLVSTLKRVVAALGGKFEIVARSADGPRALELGDAEAEPRPIQPRSSRPR